MPVAEFAACLHSSRAEVPPREHCVLRYVLARQARERGPQVYAVFDDGSQWTFAQTLAQVESTAAALTARGVRCGDRVLVWLPNGADCLRLWFAINWLGAVFVPINTALKGAVLAHVIDNSGARLLVTVGELLPRLDPQKLAGVERIVVLSGDGDRAAGPVAVERTDLRSPAMADLDEQAPIEPWDEQSILFTSGTTGPSKGVLSSYCHLATSAAAAFEDKLHTDIRYLVQLPLFHAGATIGVYAMLLCGGSIAVVPGFDTATFWTVVRKLRVTCATILGTMASYLLKQPVGTDDGASGMRWCFVVPLNDENLRFAQRFAVDVYTQFNMTEVSCPIVSKRNPDTPNSCGRVRPGAQVRIVDAQDRDVDTGATGELCVRTERRWGMAHAYNRMPDASATAWRDGWFHTGDAMRVDAAGNFYFVDRLKDTVRRKGENISSVEVEAELLAYPGVLEAAVVGVPSSDGEEEVMAVLAPLAGALIDPAALIGFLRPRLGHFMIPRYVLIRDALPKTQTGKIQKAALREAGLAAGVWDREAHGITVKRDVMRKPDMQQGIRTFQVRQLPGAGGASIAVADWPGSEGPLVCVHGLTSSSRAFAGLATEMPQHRLLAVDCRGRGKSSKEPPYGMLQHAADLAAVMDAAGIKRATLVGHSMGAYVIAAFCAEYPERVERLVFVDGGYFLALPPGVTPDALLETMLGTFLAKLRRTWSSIDEYLAYYEQTAIYPGGVDDYGRAHFEYDLTGEPPGLRSRIVESCVAPDWRAVLDHAAVSRRLQSLQVPLLLLRAPGGLTGAGDAVVPDAVRDAIVGYVPGAQVIDIPDTNHHTVLFSVPGARAVASAISNFLRDGESDGKKKP